MVSHNDEFIHNHLFLVHTGRILHPVLVTILSMRSRLCCSSGRAMRYAFWPTFLCTLYQCTANNNFYGLGCYPQWMMVSEEPELQRHSRKNENILEESYCKYTVTTFIFTQVYNKPLINLQANRHVSYFIVFTDAFVYFFSATKDTTELKRSHSCKGELLSSGNRGKKKGLPGIDKWNSLTHQLWMWLTCIAEMCIQHCIPNKRSTNWSSV